MRSVALFGQMASGKSLVSEGLVDSGYVQQSFAAPIKNIAALAYGPIEKAQPYKVTDRHTGLLKTRSGREILQDIGQYIKDLDRDFWLKCFLNRAEAFGNQPLVVDDGRFAFERDALVSRGWLIVGISTTEETRFERYEMAYGRKPTAKELNHESETELPSIIDNAELIIDGEGDPYMNVRSILEHAQNSTASTS